MRLLMVSGDRQVVIGERGPFFAMQREFSRWFDRVDVICPRPDSQPKVSVIHERVHFHPADCGRGKMASYIRRRGRELIAEHGASLIVSHDYGWFYNGLGSAHLSRETGVPYLSEIHHVPGHPVAADWRERFDRRVARAYVRWASSRAIAFRVVNEIEMPALLERWGVPREKIVVLPSLYVDLSVFAPPREPIEAEQDVVFVGRMVRNKGLFTIVDALASLARSGRRLRALFVGRGPMTAAVRDRVKRHGLEGEVRFVEWVAEPADLADVYRKSRVCVCASTCEGGPRFTVEAMACGVPVVSTPVGVMKELLADAAGGALFDFGAEELAAALESVLTDEERRRALGRSAHATAQRFEYARTIRNYAHGLLRLAGETPPSVATHAEDASHVADDTRASGDTPRSSVAAPHP